MCLIVGGLRLESPWRTLHYSQNPITGIRVTKNKGKDVEERRGEPLQIGAVI